MREGVRTASYGYGTRLTWRPVDHVWGSKGSNLLAHSLDEVLADLFAVLIAIVQRHVRINTLPLDVVIKAAQFIEAMLSSVRPLACFCTSSLHPGGPFTLGHVLMASQGEGPQSH